MIQGFHNRDKTHCKNGHELIPGNIKNLSNSTHRVCLACTRMRAAKYRAEFRVLHPKKVRPTIEQKFWMRVDKRPNGCWLWIGAKSGGKDSDYGVFIRDRKNIYAHRFSFELFKSEIPEGYQLDHLCRNRSCVNPDHLEPVTQKENVLRGISSAAINSSKTHCKRGHKFTPKNTDLKTGWRRCKTCIKNYMKEYWASHSQ